MFTGKSYPVIYNVVKTIGGKYLIPKGVGTVSWSYIYDELKLHTNRLNNLIYFTDSPANILSTTSLAGSMKYDEVTWVLTKSKYSIFTWYFGKYNNTIARS